MPTTTDGIRMMAGREVDSCHNLRTFTSNPRGPTLSLRASMRFRQCLPQPNVKAAICVSTGLENTGKGKRATF